MGKLPWVLSISLLSVFVNSAAAEPGAAVCKVGVQDDAGNWLQLEVTTKLGGNDPATQLFSHPSLPAPVLFGRTNADDINLVLADPNHLADGSGKHFFAIVGDGGFVTDGVFSSVSFGFYVGEKTIGATCTQPGVAAPVPNHHYFCTADRVEDDTTVESVSNKFPGGNIGDVNGTGYYGLWWDWETMMFMELSNLKYTRAVGFDIASGATFMSARTQIPADPLYEMPALDLAGDCRLYDPAFEAVLPTTSKFGIGMFGLDTFLIPEQGVVTGTLIVDKPIVASHASFSIGIEHDRVGDLKVTVVRPDGVVPVLDQKTVDGWWHYLKLGTLDLPLGFNVQGEWKVIVEDLETGIGGTIDLIELIVTD